MTCDDMCVGSVWSSVGHSDGIYGPMVWSVTEKDSDLLDHDYSLWCGERLVIEVV